MLRPEDTVETVRSASQVYQLVSEFTVPIGIGLLVDWQFGTMPWGLMVGTFCGLGLGILRVRMILKKLEQQDRANKKRNRERTIPVNLIWLALSTVTTWFVASVVLFFVSDRSPWLPSTVAMAICLLPAMGTLAIVGRMERRSAVEAIGAVLVAPLVRLIAVSVLGAMAYAVCPGLRREPLDFLAWTCGFYLLTLVVETALLLPNKRSMAIPESTDSPQP